MAVTVCGRGRGGGAVVVKRAGVGRGDGSPRLSRDRTAAGVWAVPVPVTPGLCLTVGLGWLLD